jgi:hypothetical protein
MFIAVIISLNTLKTGDYIKKIGEELICDKDYLNYPDLLYDPENGILPRYLVYYDYNRKEDGVGCVIVGLNPGQSDEKEHRFYIDNGASYENSLRYWKDRIQNLPYYVRLRNIANEFGFLGPILWTELVKCENSTKGKNLCVETIRDDINKYLFREIDVISEEWPLIGVGRRAYEILSYSFPKRFIIGLPHVTGSYGGYYKLFNNGKIKGEISDYICDCIRGSKKKAIWVADLLSNDN